MNIESFDSNRFFDDALRVPLRRRFEHAEGMTVWIRVETKWKNKANLICIAYCVMRIAKTNLQNKANFHISPPSVRSLQSYMSQTEKSRSSRLCGSELLKSFQKMTKINKKLHKFAFLVLFMTYRYGFWWFIRKNKANLLCIAYCVMRIAKTNLQNKANFLRACRLVFDNWAFVD